VKPKTPIELLILTVRGQRVILDADLAELYGVPTKRFNEPSNAIGGDFPMILRFNSRWRNLMPYALRTHR
jgi:hypothetical protein